MSCDKQPKRTTLRGKSWETKNIACRVKAGKWSKQMTSIKHLDNNTVWWWTSVPLAQDKDYLLYRSQVAGISSLALEASNIIQVPLIVILYPNDRYLQTRFQLHATGCHWKAEDTSSTSNTGVPQNFHVRPRNIWNVSTFGCSSSHCISGIRLTDG